MLSPSCRRLVSTVAKHKSRASRTTSGPPRSLALASLAPPASFNALYNDSIARPGCPQNHQQTRGKKTKSIVNLIDLPQGPIRSSDPPLPVIEEEQYEGPVYPTVVLQARRNMAKFENCVLLTRVGGFYELYFEHAEEYGPLLNLKVASKKTNAGPVPMVSDSAPSPCSDLPQPARPVHTCCIV